MFIELSVAPGRSHRYVPGRMTESLVRRMRQDVFLAADFDQYLDDLIDICGKPNRVGVPAHRFIRRNEARLLALVRNAMTPSAFDAPAICREIANLVEITRCYDFRVSPRDEGRMRERLAFHLGWTACTAAHSIERFAP